MSRERRVSSPSLDADIIIANAPDPVFVADLDGKIRLANDAVSELLGFRPDQVLEQSLLRFIGPEETREFLVALREVVDHGVTRNARLHPVTAGGGIIPTTLNASALRDADGVVIGVIGILRDMRELDKARAYAENLIKNAPDPVFVCDLQGKILQANDAVSELLGFREDEVVEQSLSRFISVEETREFTAAIREVVECGVTRNARLNPRSAGGDVIPTILNASALRDSHGRVIGAIGILRDMRAYAKVVRDLEESRRELDDANRAKDQFLATLSHELRTPLTAMLGWARLLRTRTLDEATSARAAEAVERNTRLLGQLIDDLLDVSRIVTGKLRLDRRPVDAVPVMEAAIDAVQPLAEGKGIRLSVALEPDASLVHADPDRLQQVIWNLLSNAIKFTPEGGRVELRLQQTGRVARVTVRDTGCGISAAFLPHVFERFRQDDVGSRTHGGLGLGLAIVRHIVAMHEGTVRAESPGEGLGSTFTVELPLLAAPIARAVTGPARRRYEDSASASAAVKGLRLLLVDDDPDARDVLTTILQHAGAEVRLAASTADALAILSEWRPDVLVSDIGMPGDDGYVLIEAVRARAAPDDLPALAVTAYARAEDRIRALSAGFQRHMAKPLEPDELVSAIASLGRPRQRARSGG
jgi:PAS domain S-box-containing protein